MDIAADGDGAFLFHARKHFSHPHLPSSTESAPTTGCTLDSSCSTSRAWNTREPRVNKTFFTARHHGASKLTRSQSRRTSFSDSCLHCIRVSIQPSSVGMAPGSVAGERRCGSGDRAVSISMLFSMVATEAEQCGYGWFGDTPTLAEIWGGKRGAADRTRDLSKGVSSRTREKKIRYRPGQMIRAAMKIKSGLYSRGKRRRRRWRAIESP